MINRLRIVDYQLTEHAQESLRKRSRIRIEWIQEPEKVESDRVDPDLEHRLGCVQAYGNRVLRVVIKKDTNPLRIITFYFDRKMRNQL